jgi:hypothetical protein
MVRRTKRMFLAIILLGLIVEAHGNNFLSQTARKFDEFNIISFDDERARLDIFISYLQREPGAQGFIIVYAGRYSRPNEAISFANRAKWYMTGSRGIESGRIEIRDGGFRELRTIELWIIPRGANQPASTPTLRPEQAVIRYPRRGRRTSSANLSNSQPESNVNRSTQRGRRRRRM